MEQLTLDVSTHQEVEPCNHTKTLQADYRKRRQEFVKKKKEGIQVDRARRVKSRKKRTHEEALEAISNLAMQLQNEKEMYLMLNSPIDRTDHLILTMVGITDLEQARMQNEENMDYIQWKMKEDFGRFVKKGTHKLGAYPYTFTKE